MAIINLRDYYPFYTSDCFMEVSEEVAEMFKEFDRKEAAYRLRTYRHKAYYSLDRDDGLEHEAVFVALSPHELYERKVTMEQTVMCEGKPYYAVGGQLCRYPKFVPEDYVLLKLTPSHAKDNWYRWDQEIPPGSPKELARAAREFSLLKIGYRGDMAFRNAEVIDVPLFLTDGITQGEPVQTTSELRELLFEHVEREQREYTDSLYRMTQGQLIANAGEIEANRFCYNALLTMRLDREQLKVLAAMDNPLEAVRGAWASAQEVGQEEDFSHTLFEICEQTAQEQTMRMK